MDLIERIGPALGIAAFVGLAVLVFFLFQQGRDIRRLREWAGRAPERAREAAEASLAAAEARGEAAEAAEGAEEAERGGLRGRLAAFRKRVSGAVGPRWRELDRRLPIHPQYLLAGAAVVLVAAAVLTSGFGLFGEEGGKKRGHSRSKDHPPVAVLNGTAVSGLAAKVESQVVEPAGYKQGPVTNTDNSVSQTVVMFVPGKEGDANALAKAVEPKLGQTATAPMTAVINSLADPAPLALVVGADDSEF
jgi:hypothetical protein